MKNMVSKFNVCCCDKYPIKSNLGGKGLILAHSSRFQSIIMGEKRRKKLEAASYMVYIGHMSGEINACMLACTQSHLYTYIYSPCSSA